MDVRTCGTLLLGSGLLCALASGCIVIDTGPGSSGGGSQSFAFGADDGGDGATNCTLPSLGGVPVPTVNTDASTTGTVGGTIASGTYYLTSIDVAAYAPGMPPAPLPEVWVFDATNGTLRMAAMEGDGGVSGVVATYFTSDNMLIFDGACGSSDNGAWEYTATPASVVTYDQFAEVTKTYSLR